MTDTVSFSDPATGTATLLELTPGDAFEGLFSGDLVGVGGLSLPLPAINVSIGSAGTHTAAMTAVLLRCLPNDSGFEFSLQVRCQRTMGVTCARLPLTTTGASLQPQE